MSATSITPDQLHAAQQALAQYPNNPAVAWGVLASFGDQYAQAAYQGIGVPGSYYSSVIDAANSMLDTPQVKADIAKSTVNGYVNGIAISTPNLDGSYNLPNTTQIESNYAVALALNATSPLAGVDLSIAKMHEIGLLPGNWYSGWLGLGLDPTRIGPISDAAHQIPGLFSIINLGKTSLIAGVNVSASFVESVVAPNPMAGDDTRNAIKSVLNSSFPGQSFPLTDLSNPNDYSSLSYRGQLANTTAADIAEQPPGANAFSDAVNANVVGAQQAAALALANAPPDVTSEYGGVRTGDPSFMPTPAQIQAGMADQEDNGPGSIPQAPVTSEYGGVRSFDPLENATPTPALAPAAATTTPPTAPSVGPGGIGSDAVAGATRAPGVDKGGALGGMPAPNAPAATESTPGTTSGGNGQLGPTPPDDPTTPVTTPVNSGGIGSAPIELDLSGSGIGIAQLASSNTFEAINTDGYQHRTAWAAAGDAVLFVGKRGARPTLRAPAL